MSGISSFGRGGIFKEVAGSVFGVSSYVSSVRFQVLSSLTLVPNFTSRDRQSYWELFGNSKTLRPGSRPGHLYRRYTQSLPEGRLVRISAFETKFAEPVFPSWPILPRVMNAMELLNSFNFIHCQGFSRRSQKPSLYCRRSKLPKPRTIRSLVVFDKQSRETNWRIDKLLTKGQGKREKIQDLLTRNPNY